MAEIALTVAINKAVDVAAQLVASEWSRLKGLTEDIRWLETQMKHMSAYIQDAEAKQDNDPKVKTLVQQVRDLAYDVELILDAVSLENQDRASQGVMKSVVCILPYCLTRRNFAKEIESIKLRVQAIEVDRRTYSIEDTHKDGANKFNADPRIDALHFDEPVVVGQDNDIQNLEKKLLDGEEGWPFVAIVGMAGLGKTTLAKRVFKSVRDKFDCSAMVTVSQNLSEKDVLLKIAKQIGLQEPEKKEVSDLYSFLENERYVILLDDIWRTTDWDKLRTFFPTSNNNSRIIITSRDDGVGRYIGGGRCLHHLDPFEFQTSWDLFNELINPFLKGTREEFESSELGCLGKKIVERCGGVALAIIVAVGMLRESEASETAWNEVLMSIGRDSEDKCNQILALSYRDLPSELKACFLYLGLFPEDYEISVSQLVRMWVAENFIQECNGLEMEDVGEKYVRKLATRNLIQVVSRKYDGRIKRIRMHDLLHSLCVSVAEEINFFHVALDDGTKHLTRVRRISVQQQSMETGVDLVKKNIAIKTFLDFHRDSTRRLPPSRGRVMHRWMCSRGPWRVDRVIVKKGIICEALNVVSVEEALQLTAFHGGSIKNLSQLKDVWPDGLRYSSRIPIFKGLQTLDLGIFVMNVPAFIWKMKQLRHLLLRYSMGHISYNIIERYFLPKTISLPKLQTLQTISADQVMGFIVPDSFPNLRKLGLDDVTNNEVKKLCGQEPISKTLQILNISPRNGCVIEKLDLSRYIYLAKLVISSSMEHLELDTHIREVKFPPNLVKLVLERATLEDPMQALKSLPKLRILEMEDCYEGTLMDCSGPDSFPQLEVLCITVLENLKEIIGGEERGMHKLKSVEIAYCPNLQKMPEWFQQLDVKISGCDNLEK